MMILPLPPSLLTRAWVTDAPMNSLSGARKVCTLIESSGAISVSMSITGVPASIILFTGAVRVPMPKAWMATKSHCWEAMLSMAARCFTASSWPSNQVTSTLKSLPQYSAACLPCAHHVACRPALEKAAFSGFSDLPASLAIAARAGEKSPAAPATDASFRRSRRDCVLLSDMGFLRWHQRHLSYFYIGDFYKVTFSLCLADIKVLLKNLMLWSISSVTLIVTNFWRDRWLLSHRRRSPLAPA